MTQSLLQVSRLTLQRSLSKTVALLFCIIGILGINNLYSQSIPMASNYFLTTNNSGDLDSVRFVDRFAYPIGWDPTPTPVPPTAPGYIFGSGQACNSSGGFVPGVSPMFNIGFGFRFMGVVYTTFNITAQGAIGLGVPASCGDSIGSNYPGGGADKPLINAFEMDQANGNPFGNCTLRVDTSGIIRYKLVNAPTEKVLVIEFKNMNIADRSYNSKDGHWQVRLYEKSGNIEFVYGKMTIRNANINNQVRIGFSSSSTQIKTVKIDTFSIPRTIRYFDMNNLHTNYFPNNQRVKGLFEYDTTRNRTFRFTPYNPATFLGVPLFPYLYRPIPPVSITDLAPTALKVNWRRPIPITGVLGYLVYQSTSGLVGPWTVIDSISDPNDTSTQVIGLDPNKEYCYRVVSYSEGSLSDPTEICITTPGFAGIIRSIRNGMWSDGLTWDLNRSPNGGDSVVIMAGHSVCIDSTQLRSVAEAGGLTVMNGGILRFCDNAVGRTLMVHSELVIQGGGLFEVDTPSVFNEIHKVMLARSVRCDGVMDMYKAPPSVAAEARAEIIFNSQFSPYDYLNNRTSGAKISGWGEIDFWRLIINKSLDTNRVEVDSQFFGFRVRNINGPTVPAFVTIQRGTFVINGYFQQGSELFEFAVPDPIPGQAGYLIPNKGAFELNNPNFYIIPGNSYAHIEGIFTLKKGKVGVGINTSNAILLWKGSRFNMYASQNDSVILSGRFEAIGRTTLDMRGGIIKVSTIGNATGSASFSITPVDAQVVWDGGKIEIEKPKQTTGNSPFIDYEVFSDPNITESADIRTSYAAGTPSKLGLSTLLNYTIPGTNYKGGTVLQFGNQFTGDFLLLPANPGMTFAALGHLPHVTLNPPPTGFAARRLLFANIVTSQLPRTYGDVQINAGTQVDINGGFWNILGEYTNNHGLIYAPKITNIGSAMRFMGTVQQRYVASISAQPTGDFGFTAAGANPHPQGYLSDFIIYNDKGVVLDPYSRQIRTRGVWFWTGGITNCHRFTLGTGTFSSDIAGPYPYNRAGDTRTKYGLYANSLQTKYPCGNYDLLPVYDVGNLVAGANGPGTVPAAPINTYSVLYYTHYDKTNLFDNETHLTKFEIPPFDSVSYMDVWDFNTSPTVKYLNQKSAIKIVTNDKLVVLNNLRLQEGVIETDSTNVLILKNPTTTAQLTFNDAQNYYPRALSWVRGPIERRLQPGINWESIPPPADSARIFFPVGASTFSPLWFMRTKTAPAPATGVDVRVGQVDADLTTQPEPADCINEIKPISKYWYHWAKPNTGINSPGDPVNLLDVQPKVYHFDIDSAFNPQTNSWVYFPVEGFSGLDRLLVWDTTIYLSQTLQQYLPNPLTINGTGAIFEDAGRINRDNVNPPLNRNYSTEGDILNAARLRSQGNYMTGFMTRITQRVDTLQRLMFYAIGSVTPIEIVPPSATKCEKELIFFEARSTDPNYRWDWVDYAPPIQPFYIVNTWGPDSMYPTAVMDTTRHIVVTGGLAKCPDPYTYSLVGRKCPTPEYPKGRIEVSATASIFVKFNPNVELPNELVVCTDEPIEIKPELIEYSNTCNGDDTTFFKNENPAIPVPDDDTVYGANSNIDVFIPQFASDFYLCEVCITVEHSVSGELDIDLIGPNGQKVDLVLVNNADVVNAYHEICIQDPSPAIRGGIASNAATFPIAPPAGGNPYQPDAAPYFAAQFPAGVNNGTWKLRIKDHFPPGIIAPIPLGQDGLIVSWNMRFCRTVYDSLHYQWQTLSGQIAPYLNSPNVRNPIFMPPTNPVLDTLREVYYRMVLTDQRTGCSDTDTVKLNIGRITDRPAAQSLTFCGPTANVDLRAYAASGCTDCLLWFSDSTTMSSLPTNTFNSQILNLPMVANTDTFYVAEVANIGIKECVGLRRMVIVTINPLPVPPSIQGTEIPLCAGANAWTTLTATAATNGFTGTYAWYDAPTGGNLKGTGPTFQTPVLSGTTKFYAETRMGDCVSRTRAVFEVRVNSGVGTLNPPTVMSNNAVCSGENASVTMANPNATGMFRWYNQVSGGMAVDSMNTMVLMNLNRDTTFYVEVFDGVCASARQMVTAMAVPRPQIDTLTFARNVPANANIAVGYIGSVASTYDWDFGPNAMPTTAQGAGPHVVRWNKDGNYPITLRARNVRGSHSCETVEINNIQVGANAIAGTINANNSLSIYPNPTTNSTTLYLTLVNAGQKVQIEVFDVVSKKVYSEEISSVGNMFEKTLDLAKFGAGVYNVRVKADAEVFNSRVVVK